MAYLAETGWFKAGTERASDRSLSRWIAQIVSVALAMIPIQSSAAQKEGLFAPAVTLPRIEQLSLAEQEIRAIERSGMHCRSTIDGSNPDAVRQARFGRARPESYHHVDTQVWPEHGGRHAFVMVYTLADSAGHRVLHRAYGWLDSADCSARITHN